MSLLDTTSDDVSIFITKKWIKVQDQSGNAKQIQTKQTNKI